MHTRTRHRSSRPSRLVRDRIDSVPTWVLLIQLFIGLGWLRAGVEKVISTEWRSGVELDRFLVEHGDVTVWWYRPFVDLAVEPSLVAVSAVVMLGQLAIGTALIVGRGVGPALAVGMLLNLHFVAAGAVDPSVFYLLAQGAVALWLVESSARRRTSILAAGTTVGAAALAVVSVSGISNLHPAEVVDDPALMLSMVGVLAALAGVDSLRRRGTARRSGQRPASTAFATGSYSRSTRSRPVNVSASITR